MSNSLNLSLECGGETSIPVTIAQEASQNDSAKP